MPTSYPGAIDSLTNPSSSSTMDNPPHDEQHANSNDAVEAIETELGINPRGPYANVKERLDQMGLPVGAGAIWFKSTPPPKWLICNGAAIPPQYTELIALIGPNTPNLTDRFPLGGPTPGASGGSLNHLHNIPSSGSLTVNTTGSSHTHVVPNINNGGSHTHPISGQAAPSGSQTPGTASGTVVRVSDFAGHGHGGDTLGSTHDHVISDTTTSGSGHTHDLAGHSHTGDTGTANPPYLRVVFIIKAAL